MKGHNCTSWFAHNYGLPDAWHTAVAALVDFTSIFLSPGH
jgi:hypothetical protein